MKMLSVLCLAICITLPAAVSARGMGSPTRSGGAFGSSATAPGTNSLGTALSSDAAANGHPMTGPALGTDPAIDKEELRLNKMLEGSICRGC
jgi:hypothetical protein